MLEVLVILMLTVAYRLRGMGFPPKLSGRASTTNGRLTWSAACGMSALFMTGDAQVAALSVLCAYAGMMLGHSKHYQFKKRIHYGTMTLICGSRHFLLLLPLGLSALSLVPFAAVAGMLAYLLGRKAYDLGWTEDQLRVSEPIAGAVFGAFLILGAML